MKTRGVLAIILITCWFGVVPAAAHDCCHHDQHYADCNDCNHDCDHGGAQGSRHCCDWTPSGGATDLRTAEGKITEVVYLPGATPDGGMVEVRLQSAGQIPTDPPCAGGIPETERSAFERGRHRNRERIPRCRDGGRPPGCDGTPQRRKDPVLTRPAWTTGLVAVAQWSFRRFNGT